MFEHSTPFISLCTPVKSIEGNSYPCGEPSIVWVLSTSVFFKFNYLSVQQRVKFCSPCFKLGINVFYWSRVPCRACSVGLGKIPRYLLGFGLETLWQ